MRQIKVGLQRRPESRNWYTTYVPAEGAKPVRHSTGTPDEGEAERVRETLEKKLNRELQYEGQDRYKDIAGPYVHNQRSRNTQAAWLRAMRRWDPLIGDLYIAEIGEDHVQEFVKRRRKQKVVDATIRNELAYLSALLTHAGVPWHQNPVKLYNKRHLKGAAWIVRFLLPEEEQRLLGACLQTIHRLMVIFAIETGLRAQEQLSLKSWQVDLGKRELLIPPENAKDRQPRVVPLSARAIWVLTEVGLSRDWVFTQTHRPDHEDEPFAKVYPWWDREGAGRGRLPLARPAPYLRVAVAAGRRVPRDLAEGAGSQQPQADQSLCPPGHRQPASRDAVFGSGARQARPSSTARRGDWRTPNR